MLSGVIVTHKSLTTVVVLALATGMSDVANSLAIAQELL